MLVHYNLYNDPRMWSRSRTIAVFYFGNCTIEDMIAETRKMIEMIDSSIGHVFYSDWSWEMEHGVTKIESSEGCDLETLTEICDKIINNIKNTQL